MYVHIQYDIHHNESIPAAITLQYTSMGIIIKNCSFLLGFGIDW